MELSWWVSCFVLLMIIGMSLCYLIDEQIGKHVQAHGSWCLAFMLALNLEKSDISWVTDSNYALYQDFFFWRR